MMIPDSPLSDAEKIARLRDGKPLCFGSRSGVGHLTQAERAVRTIRAEWIAALASASERTIPVPIEIDSAVIEGNLSLHGVTFTRDVSMTNSLFTGECDISGVLLQQGVSFNGSRFLHPVSFAASRFSPDARNDATFLSVTFENAVNFDQVEVGGSFRCAAAQQSSRFCEPVSLVRARIHGDAVFDGVECHATFHADQVEVDGNLSFDNEARAPAYLVGPASFQEMTVRGNVHFGRARFGAEVSFQGARLLADASFDGTRFGGSATFERAYVLGSAFFYVPATGRSAWFGAESWFVGASFEGDLVCAGVHFAGAAHFERTIVNGKAFFIPTGSGACVTFAKDASFAACEVRGDFICTRVQFIGPVDLRGAQFKGDAIFQGARFDAIVRGERLGIGGTLFCDPSQDGRETVLGGPVFLNSARVGGDFNGKGVTFEHQLMCERMDIGGSALFSPTGPHSTRFSRGASFQLATIGGLVDFTEARFEGPVTFRGMNIAGDATFNGARCANEALFDRLHVGGAAYFLPSRPRGCVVFGGPVSFLGAEIGGDAYFIGVEFCADARFERSTFGSNVIFDVSLLPSCFLGSVSFNGTRVRGAADFTGVIFLQDASFGQFQVDGPVSFFCAYFARDAMFLGLTAGSHAIFQKTEFRSNVNFALARIDGYVDLPGAHVVGNLILSESHFTVVVLEPDELTRPVGPARFDGPIDLRGMTYDRIDGDWRLLADHCQPTARQPYAQMEKTLRAMGEDRQADIAYLTWRARERSVLWPSDPWRAVWSTLYRLFVNYGVRPLRLAVMAFVILAVGAILYSGTDAVTLQSPNPVNLATGAQSVAHVTLVNGFGVSLNTFLPFETPAGSQWRPSDTTIVALGYRLGITYAAYGTFERIAGWILVPLGVAAIAGILKRRPNF